MIKLLAGSDIMPVVINKHHYYRKPVPKNSVYIGRPTKWGNPFVIGVHGDRDQVIEKYRQYILMNPELYAAVKTELRGKNLICYCAPKPCHGDILLQMANS